MRKERGAVLNVVAHGSHDIAGVRRDICRLVSCWWVGYKP